MEQQLTIIREQQKESWNKFSPGWKKWDRLFMDFLKPMGDEIVRLLDPKGTEIVLDVASGTGEPGLTIAKQLTGGKVVITDLAKGMLDVARENADRKGVTNIEILDCDVCELPFEDNTFDAISCRFGFMFFPDMVMAMNEMVRVLKPGGRIATSVWNVPERNFWITATMGTINRNMQIPPQLPTAPGMFRCSKNNLMAGLFEQAGLKNISVREVTGRLQCKTTDVYWSVMTELAAPVVAALSNADTDMKEKIKKEVHQAVSQKYSDGNVLIEGNALVIYGVK